MNPTRTLLRLAYLTAISVASAACAGTPAQATFPAVERSALELTPSDAYFAARIDVERLRAQPSWPSIEAAVARDEPELARTLQRLDRVYLAVGGLVPAPLTEATGSAEGDDAVPVERPVWYDLAQTLGGRVPAAVAVLDGPSAAELCSAAMLTGQPREIRGHRVAVRAGIALMVEAERRCIVTLEPALETLLAAPSSRHSPALSRLARLGRAGDLGVASVALELDAPAFEATMAAIEPPPSADENARRWAEVARRVFAILTQGIGAVDWVARTHPGGYRSEGHLVATDADRGTMWREITEVYWDIVRAFVEADVLPDDVASAFRTALEGMSIERTDDGFVIAHFVPEAVISGSLEGMARGPLDPVMGEPEESTMPLDVFASIRGTARDTVGAIEPRLAELDGLSAYERLLVRRELAAAYASLGRLEDARTQLRSAMGDAEESSDDEQRAFLAADLCAIELEHGNLARARSGIDQARELCALGNCGLARAAAAACRARVLAAEGELEEALATLDETAEQLGGYASTAAMDDAHVTLLIEAGRPNEAAAAARAFRFARGASGEIGRLAALEALALAGTTVSMDVVNARLAMASERREPLPSQRVIEEGEVLDARIACIARASRAPTSAETHESCDAAVARSVEVHGESHPETIRARLARARMLGAARDRRGVEAELRQIDAALSDLPADNLLRAERARLTAPRRGR